MFDHWIHNSDREKYNPNLLWDSTANSMVVIDHNMAFDDDYNALSLSKDHVFSQVDRQPFRDMIQRCLYMDRMDKAIAAMETQIDKIPEEWGWADLEQTRRIDLDLNAWLTVLKRYQTQDNVAFWSVL